MLGLTGHPEGVPGCRRGHWEAYRLANRRIGGCSALLAWKCSARNLTWLGSTASELRAKAVQRDMQGGHTAKRTVSVERSSKGGALTSTSAADTLENQLAVVREPHSGSTKEHPQAPAGEATSIPATSQVQSERPAEKQRTNSIRRRRGAKSAPGMAIVGQGEGLRTGATNAVATQDKARAREQPGPQHALDTGRGGTSSRADRQASRARLPLQRKSEGNPPEQASTQGSSKEHEAGMRRRNGTQSPLHVAAAVPEADQSSAPGGTGSRNLPVKVRRQGRAPKQRHDKPQQPRQQQQAAEHVRQAPITAPASGMLTPSSPQAAVAVASAAAGGGQGQGPASLEPQGLHLQRRQQGGTHQASKTPDQRADKQEPLHMRRLAARSRSTATTAARAAATAEVLPAAAVQPSQREPPLQQPAQQLQGRQLQTEQRPSAGQLHRAGSQTLPQPALIPSSQALPDLAHLATPAALRLLQELGLPAGQLAATLAAAAAAAQRPASQRAALPLQEADVRAAASVLVDGLGLAVSKLPAVLVAAPEVLVLGQGELHQRASALASLHRSVKALRLRLPQHPHMLGTPFISQLGPGLQALVSLGLSRQQACRAVVCCPDIVHRRRYELAAAFHSLTGAPVEQACPQLLALLARFPQLLMPGGCPELAPALSLLQEFGLQPQQAVRVLAGCPKLVRLPQARVRSVVNLLRSRGFKQEDLVAVIRGWPPVLAAELSRIRSVLALLEAAGLPPSKVVAYPRVFYHDPANYTAPRLAYLKAYRPQQVEQWGLANILSNGDPEFVELKCKTSLEEYLLFKKRWLSLYGARFGLGPSQAGPLQRVLRQQLAKEVSEQLFSHIDWDRV